MNKKVIIIGGEGNGGVIAACIEDNRKRFGDLEWEVAGFVNDYETQVCGYPVLGGTDDVQELLKNPDYHFMWGIHMIGRNILTEKTFRKVNIPRERFATIVHKTAFVADSAVLEPGVFVMSNCYVGAPGAARPVFADDGQLVGRTQHDSRTALPFLGRLDHQLVHHYRPLLRRYTRCQSDRKVKIGDFAVAGAGSLVTHNIPDYEIHVGTPAKFMKRVRED